MLAGLTSPIICHSSLSWDSFIIHLGSKPRVACLASIRGARETLNGGVEADGASRIGTGDTELKWARLYLKKLTGN